MLCLIRNNSANEYVSNKFFKFIYICLDVQQESKCVWVTTVETVEKQGTLRFKPPLATDEYIREVIIERMDNEQVKINAQICKYLIQRTTCDKKVNIFILKKTTKFKSLK